MKTETEVVKRMNELRHRAEESEKAEERAAQYVWEQMADLLAWVLMP